MGAAGVRDILVETGSLAATEHPAGFVDLPFDHDMVAVLRRAARTGRPLACLSVPDDTDDTDLLAVLRAIPGLAVLRPAEPGEIGAALRFAAARDDGPTVVLLCCPGPRCAPGPPAELFGERGGWVVAEPDQSPELVLLSSGAQLPGTLRAARRLTGDGVAVRVISVPWRERFLEQPAAVLERLLPPSIPRMVVEATSPRVWWPVVGRRGAVLSGGCAGHPEWAHPAVPAPRRSPDHPGEEVRAVAHDVLLGAGHGW